MQSDFLLYQVLPERLALQERLGAPGADVSLLVPRPS